MQSSSSFKGNKTTLPSKPCYVCQRDMVWRKAWAKNWQAVLYCSAACRLKSKAKPKVKPKVKPGNTAQQLHGV